MQLLDSTVFAAATNTADDQVLYRRFRSGELYRYFWSHRRTPKDLVGLFAAGDLPTDEVNDAIERLLNPR
ncbi:MAG: hypothetical protein JO108_18735 [Acidobacteriaceae bacterium]|nr:hypothetical protein [Acidobacteriaceae bacterium]